MKKIMLFGGSGFIGQNCAQALLGQGYEPIIVTRGLHTYPNIKSMQWDAQNIGDWMHELKTTDIIINLCGKSVDCVKTPENCDEILRSRVDTTLLIGKALQQIHHSPELWIQMSTAHIYGDSETTLCSEDSSSGYGLAPYVGKKWEDAFYKAVPNHTRKVILRTSFVLGKNGGAFQILKKLAQYGVGGQAGSGHQGISWIHEEDLNQIIINSIKNNTYQDIIIASAPKPLSNKKFMQCLRKSLKQRIGIPSPAWLIRFTSKYILKKDPELILYGRYVKSNYLEKLKFQFTYPTLEKAIKNLI